MDQNKRFDEEVPRTYGEESEWYEQQDKDRRERAAGGQAGGGSYGGQPYGNQPVGQPYGNQPGSQPYGNQPGGQPYGNPYGDGSYGGQPYGNQPGGQPYGNQPYGNPYGGWNGQYGYRQPQYGQVKDVFCYILLAIMVARMLVGVVTSLMMFDAIDDYSSLMNGTYVYKLMNNGMYSGFSSLSSLLFIGYIVFVILDIVAVSKAGYKVTGLILFAIFLTPGYYIWRAHVLGRKKMVPIIFTVLYSLLTLINIGIMVTEVFSLTAELMQTMYY